MVLPSALLSLLPPEQRTHFVLQRAPDPCLWLYPLDVWKKELEQIHEKINLFSPDGRSFLRLFQSGAQPLSLDPANRLLLPKALCEYAGLSGDLVLIGMKDRVEIWDLGRYEAWKAQHEKELGTWTQRMLGS